jgi:hypothetical protein
MAYFSTNNGNNEKNSPKKKFYSKRWFRVFGTLVLILAIAGGVMAWKTGSVLNRIFKEGLFPVLLTAFPELKIN